MVVYNLLITVILIVLFLICLWNLYIIRKKKYHRPPDKDLPLVSVLVPARNEEQNIKNVLTSLLDQDYPEYELIVLDDNSEDSTPLIIEIKIKSKAEITIGKPLKEMD
jgi:cellulose synthase/poly-beta-1,6-N-acetylglucosamine synthase-like glycosyltransferase